MKNLYTNQSKQNASPWLMLPVFIFAIIVGFTLAYFFTGDFASKYLNLSGAVKIEAVGPGPTHTSIEDTLSESKLIINLEDNYDRLIPGMRINIPANCKVYRSTTKPLLRALLDLRMYETDLTTESEDLTISSDLYGQLASKIEENGWYLHTDGYYYYVGDIVQTEPENGGGGYTLKEVDATLHSVVVDFIKETDIITFPELIDSTYSGKGVKISITFQAIQNYIPNDKGEKLPNTITNSLKLFNYIESSKLTPTPLEYFNVSTVNGKTTLSLKPETVALLPEVVVLPSTDAEGNAITALDTTFAGNCGNVKNLIVPSTYTTIEEGAFKNSTIESIDLSNTTITELPKNCFYDTDATSIKLPSTLKIVGESSLFATRLHSLIIPEGVTEIKKEALWQMFSLTYLYIPSTVEIINDLVLYAGNLRQIVVHEDNPYFYDDNNTILASIDGRLFTTVSQLPSPYTVPDGITRLVHYSLVFSKITELNLNNVTKIDSGNVFPSTIKKFIIPEYNSAFLTTTGLDLIQTSNSSLMLVLSDGTKVDYVVPDNVVRIAEQCFVNCEIGTLTIGKNVSYIAGSFFSASLIDYYNVVEDNRYYYSPTGLELIGRDNNNFLVYSNTCGNTEYTVPDGVQLIMTNAFKNSNLLTINLPDSLTRIGWSGINCPNITSLDIPSSVTFLGTYFIRNTKIEHITVYGELEYGAFQLSPKLKTIVMGETVNYIGYDAFLNCKSLEWIEFKSTTPPGFDSSNMFSGASNTWKIYVPDSAVSTYKAVPELSLYADRIYPVSERP